MAGLDPEIAVEASGSNSWLVDETERLRHRPKPANPLEAKRRIGYPRKLTRLINDCDTRRAE